MVARLRHEGVVVRSASDRRVVRRDRPVRIRIVGESERRRRVRDGGSEPTETHVRAVGLEHLVRIAAGPVPAVVQAVDLRKEIGSRRGQHRQVGRVDGVLDIVVAERDVDEGVGLIRRGLPAAAHAPPVVHDVVVEDAVLHPLRVAVAVVEVEHPRIGRGGRHVVRDDVVLVQSADHVPRDQAPSARRPRHDVAAVQDDVVADRSCHAVRLRRGAAAELEGERVLHEQVVLAQSARSLLQAVRARHRIPAENDARASVLDVDVVAEPIRRRALDVVPPAVVIDHVLFDEQPVGARDVDALCVVAGRRVSIHDHVASERHVRVPAADVGSALDDDVRVEGLDVAVLEQEVHLRTVDLEPSRRALVSRE